MEVSGYSLVLTTGQKVSGSQNRSEHSACQLLALILWTTHTKQDCKYSWLLLQPLIAVVIYSSGLSIPVRARQDEGGRLQQILGSKIMKRFHKPFSVLSCFTVPCIVSFSGTSWKLFLYEKLYFPHILSILNHEWYYTSSDAGNVL
jgi:hypothetical protein